MWQMLSKSSAPCQPTSYVFCHSHGHQNFQVVGLCRRCWRIRSPAHPGGQHDRWHARRVGCSTDNVRRSDSYGQVQSTTVRVGANRTAPDVRLGLEVGISTRRRRHLCCDPGCRLTLGAGAVGYSDQNAVKLGQPGTRLHVRHTHGTQSGTTMSQTIEYTS